MSVVGRAHMDKAAAQLLLRWVAWELRRAGLRLWTVGMDVLEVPFLEVGVLERGPIVERQPVAACNGNPSKFPSA
ncbi:hypothetical protein M7I_6541 [Glarea lozoyensis 74030]|uniref:Uncharacterized protein n=1 Tax=Glarea lozoyensis (strain ATCC 74030 / MF5533) TaxID=1104152 RepID=H0EUV2_GLAL7|nr:hypothetical protein M7I_6541 [Glarea lozoyensis 74030]